MGELNQSRLAGCAVSPAALSSKKAKKRPDGLSGSLGLSSIRIS